MRRVRARLARTPEPQRPTFLHCTTPGPDPLPLSPWPQGEGKGRVGVAVSEDAERGAVVVKKKERPKSLRSPRPAAPPASRLINFDVRPPIERIIAAENC